MGFVIEDDLIQLHALAILYAGTQEDPVRSAWV